MEKGDLTHIDLWGKYAIRSIHGNQYYLLFVDDSKQYITADCLKEKLDAAQGVINYLTYIMNRGAKPKAIQIDGGKEFINERLKTWCKERGIDIRITAPYLPAQNSAAERMNRTLVELSPVVPATLVNYIPATAEVLQCIKPSNLLGCLSI